MPISGRALSGPRSQALAQWGYDRAMAHEALPDRSNAGPSRVAVAAGVIGLVVDAVYLGIILQEGETNAGRVGVFSILVASFSVLALVGGLASGLSVGTRLVVLGASIGGLLSAGILGIFSVGLRC